MSTQDLNIKLREFISVNYGIDASVLSDKDVKTLAEFYIRALSVELPIWAEEMRIRLKLAR